MQYDRPFSYPAKINFQANSAPSSVETAHRFSPIDSPPSQPTCDLNIDEVIRSTSNELASSDRFHPTTQAKMQQLSMEASNNKHTTPERNRRLAGRLTAKSFVYVTALLNEQEAASLLLRELSTRVRQLDTTHQLTQRHLESLDQATGFAKQDSMLKNQRIENLEMQLRASRQENAKLHGDLAALSNTVDLLIKHVLAR